MLNSIDQLARVCELKNGANFFKERYAVKQKEYYINCDIIHIIFIIPLPVKKNPFDAGLSIMTRRSSAIFVLNGSKLLM